MRNKFISFMQGRYGVDTLNKHIMYLTFILIFINLFINSKILLIICYLLLTYEIFRFFSKNIYKRYDENKKYETMIAPITRFITLTKKRLSDRKHRYYRCPQCQQIVRLPKGHGKVEVSCPKCHHHFDARS